MNALLRASVIIPTFNRARSLEQCLGALATQDVERLSFEILVVDNNSSDDTRDVFQRFVQAHPELLVRYVCELKQSAGHARNRGVAEARGAILCFLDDDTLPSPAWLRELLRGFDDPQVGCAGGPAIPDYQGRARPKWLRGDLQGLLSGYKLPHTCKTPITSVAHFPFGCNMAIRRKVFADVGLFRPELDRVGRQLLTGGETDLLERAHAAGWSIVYLPDAEVLHVMAPERLERSYLYKIGWGMAASHVLRTADQRPASVLRWFASDGWYAARMLLRLCRSLLLGNSLWFDDYMRFWIVSMRVPLRARLLLSGKIV